MKTRQRILQALLGSAVLGMAAVALVAADKTPQLRPLSEREQVIHLLNRVDFGAEPGEVDRILKQGWKKWLDGQLKPDAIDDSAIEKRIAADYPSLKMELADVFANYQPKGPKPTTPEERRKQNAEANRLRAKLDTELVESVLLRAVYSERRLKEVIVDFWRNHLNVDTNKVRFQANHYEENVIRQLCFGKFEDLLLASAKHPAMLIYLDNSVSRGGALNENYAREVMELHTLGVDNGYTQKDVTELARVLTGWTCGNRRPSKNESGDTVYGFMYNDRNHDHKPAAVLGVEFDGKDGLADGEKMLRHLAHHPNTARFISSKLCRYLIEDKPGAELVDSITKVFRDTGGDLPSVYRAILLSPEFMNAKNYKGKFKTPFEYVVSALRATGAQIDNPAEIRRSLKLMGQALYECADPTGYYDQTEAWLDPGVMVYRWNFAIQLVSDKLKGTKIDFRHFAPWQNLPQNEKVYQVIMMILGGKVDERTRDSLGRILDVRGQIALALGSASFQAQ